MLALAIGALAIGIPAGAETSPQQRRLEGGVSTTRQVDTSPARAWALRGDIDRNLNILGAARRPGSPEEVKFRAALQEFESLRPLSAFAQQLGPCIDKYKEAFDHYVKAGNLAGERSRLLTPGRNTQAERDQIRRITEEMNRESLAGQAAFRAARECSYRVPQAHPDVFSSNSDQPRPPGGGVVVDEDVRREPEPVEPPSRRRDSDRQPQRRDQPSPCDNRTAPGADDWTVWKSRVADALQQELPSIRRTTWVYIDFRIDQDGRVLMVTFNSQVSDQVASAYRAAVERLDPGVLRFPDPITPRRQATVLLQMIQDVRSDCIRPGSHSWQKAVALTARAPVATPPRQPTVLQGSGTTSGPGTSAGSEGSGSQRSPVLKGSATAGGRINEPAQGSYPAPQRVEPQTARQSTGQNRTVLRSGTSSGRRYSRIEPVRWRAGQKIQTERAIVYAEDIAPIGRQTIHVHQPKNIQSMQGVLTRYPDGAIFRPETVTVGGRQYRVVGPNEIVLNSRQPPSR